MKATISLILATTFWGLNFHFAKFMLGESNFIEAGTWRYLLGVGTLFLFLLKDLKSLDKLPLKGIVLVGVIGLFAFNMLFFSGLLFTNPLNAALIVSLNPITTVLLSALILKTPVKWFHFVGASISFLGVVYLLTKGNILNLSEVRLNVGDLLIFGANLAFALNHVWVKKYKEGISNLQFTAWTNLICLLGFLTVTLFYYPVIDFNHSNNYWIWTLGIGVFGTAIAYILWNYGVTEIGADRSGIFMNVVPLATAVTSALFGIEMNLYHLVSGVIIIAGILFTQVFRLRSIQQNLAKSIN